MIRKMLPSDYNSIYKLGAQLNINYEKLNKLDDIVNDNNKKVYVYIINFYVVCLNLVVMRQVWQLLKMEKK